MILIDWLILFLNSYVYCKLYMYHSRLLLKYDKIFTKEEVLAVKNANRSIGKIMILCNLTLLLNIALNIYSMIDLRGNGYLFSIYMISDSMLLLAMIL